MKTIKTSNDFQGIHRKIQRRAIVQIILVAAFFLLPVFSPAAAPKSVITLELALNWKAEPEFGGFYAAAELLKKENIELKILEGGSATPTVQMLGAKTVPLAVVGGDELMTARERGMDIAAFFSLYQTNPHALMVRADSPWKTIEDIVQDPEAIVSVNLGLPYVAFLKKKFPRMKAKLVPYQGGVASFMTQKKMAQQCFVSAEPLLAKKSGVLTRTIPISTLGFDPYLTVVAVQKDFFLQNRELLNKINGAFKKGWALYMSAPEKYNQQMNRLNPSMPLDIFNEGALAQKPFIQTSEKKEIGSMEADRWKLLGEQLKDLKLLKKVESPQSYFISL